MKYYFGFVKAQLGTGKPEETALCSHIPKGSIVALFPAGDGENEQLLVTGNVMDVWEGTTSFSQRITVHRPLTPPGELTPQIVATKGALALKNGDADRIGQIVDGLSDLLNNKDEDEVNKVEDFFLHPDAVKERDEKADILAAQRRQSNMDARDMLLDLLAAMSSITSMTKAAIDRTAKSSGRVLAGDPSETSPRAQAIGVAEIDKTVKSTQTEGLGPDTGQAAGSAMGGTLEAVTAAASPKAECGNGTNSTNNSNCTNTTHDAGGTGPGVRRNSHRRFLLGVVGSGIKEKPALTPEQEKHKALSGGIHGSTADLGGSANAGATSGEAPEPIMSDAIKVNTKKMFPADVAGKPLGPPLKCHFICPKDKKCDSAGCEYGPLFYLPANILDYAEGAGAELGSQSNGWGANPFAWDPGSAGMGGDVSGFGLGIKVSGLPKPILVKMPLKGDDPTKGSCAFWDTANEMWSSKGCVIGKVVPPFVHCYCTHLTGES